MEVTSKTTNRDERERSDYQIDFQESITERVRLLFPDTNHDLENEWNNW